MKTIFPLFLIGFLVGCAAEPQVQTGPNAEVTYDGLVRVDNSVFQYAWIDPEVDLSVYDKIAFGKAEFEFRAVKSTSGSRASYSSRSEFQISEANQQKLIDTVGEIFDEELRKSKYFTYADEPGPDVLILNGAILDIVSRVPPDIAGRGDIFLSRVGEATLVLELADSLSGETLVRATERRAAESAGRTATRSSTVTTWAEVRRLARRWATKLRDGLDSVHRDRSSGQ